MISHSPWIHIAIHFQLSILMICHSPWITDHFQWYIILTTFSNKHTTFRYYNPIAFHFNSLTQSTHHRMTNWFFSETNTSCSVNFFLMSSSNPHVIFLWRITLGHLQMTYLLVSSFVTWYVENQELLWDMLSALEFSHHQSPEWIVYYGKRVD